MRAGCRDQRCRLFNRRLRAMCCLTGTAPLTPVARAFELVHHATARSRAEPASLYGSRTRPQVVFVSGWHLFDPTTKSLGFNNSLPGNPPTVLCHFVDVLGKFLFGLSDAAVSWSPSAGPTSPRPGAGVRVHIVNPGKVAPRRQRLQCGCVLGGDRTAELRAAAHRPAAHRPAAHRPAATRRGPFRSESGMPVILEGDTGGPVTCSCTASLSTAAVICSSTCACAPPASSTRSARS